MENRVFTRHSTHPSRTEEVFVSFFRGSFERKREIFVSSPQAYSGTLFNFEGPPSKNGGIAQERQTCEYGGVAQLGEHLPCKQGVDSSILFVSTSGDKPQQQVWPIGNEPATDMGS